MKSETFKPNLPVSLTNLAITDEFAKFLLFLNA